MNETSSPSTSDQPRRWRWLRWLLIGAAAFVLLVVFAGTFQAWLVHQPPSRVLALQESVWRLKFIGIGLQLAAVALAWWRWPGVVQWAIKRGILTPEEHPRALAARGKALAFVLILILAASLGPGGDLAHIYRAVK